MSQPVRTFDDVLPATFDAVARGGIAASQAQLPPAVRQFHHHLLRTFLSTGQPPTVDQLGEPAQRLGLDAGEALATLTEADLVHTDATGSRVEIAYPLSGRPSPHQVVMGNGASVTAMCAVDALGVPVMAGEPAVIVSADPTTGQPIRVRSDPDGWSWQPETSVVLLAATSGGGPIANACTDTAFHATAELAHEYLAHRPGCAGRVLTQAEAIGVAEAEFGPLLTGSDSSPTSEHPPIAR